MERQSERQRQSETETVRDRQTDRQTVREPETVKRRQRQREHSRIIIMTHFD